MKNPKHHPANDVPLAPSSRPTIADLIDQGQNPRRQFLKGTGAVAFTSLLGAGLPNRAHAAYPVSPAAVGGLGFTSVPANIVPMVDGCTVPAGYSVSVLMAWGDPISNGPQYNPNLPQTEAAQLQQYGMHVDGMEFFPFAGRGGPSSDRGLIAVNHEYTDNLLLWNLTAAPAPGALTLAQARAAQAAHGVAVFETRKVSGVWQVVRPSAYARRITGNTPCRISGPAAGDALMRTAADPAGTQVLGTLNNCAHGSTPWGTYLTCEENFNGYFGAVGAFTPSSLENRYGLTAAGFGGYRWFEVDPRFDMNQNRNEPNRFGWVVEIDPFDPTAQPVKRTALGRFKHESAMVVVGADNTVAVYSGDDERNDYVYKFVCTRKYNPSNRAANRDLLDDGTLYVAKFNADGTGTWIPLIHGQNGLTPANGFANQAEVLIKTRQAADRVDATEMDRPEWVAAHPVTREIYLTLTNNNRRGTNTPSTNAINGTTTAGGARPPVDAANPRPTNIYGHIIRWRETGGDVAATSFEWDIYAFAGDSLNANANLQGNINGDDFGAPDGLWFDRDGRLWIQTDQQGDALGDWVNIGSNALLASDPSTREVRRFMTSPKNCEVTGITGTPDGKTVFVGIQHPGEDWTGSFTQRSTWPDSGINGPTTLSSGGAVKPRSATLVITRNDGGKIGAI
jgi:hypothetical protein